MMGNKKYILNFSNGNNVWYTIKSFYGTEVEMLNYANEELHNKENKFYNLWIYDDKKNNIYINHVIGPIKRGKRLEKMIKLKMANKPLEYHEFVSRKLKRNR